MTDSTLKFIEDDSDKEDEILPPSPPKLKRQTTYVFTQKRQDNLRKARETKAKNKEELQRLRKEKQDKEKDKEVVQEVVKEVKPKKKKKKKIVYESESSSDEEIVVVKKKKTKPLPQPIVETKTPYNSPVKQQVRTIRHDEYIRNLLNF